MSSGTDFRVPPSGIANRTTPLPATIPKIWSCSMVMMAHHQLSFTGSASIQSYLDKAVLVVLSRLDEQDKGQLHNPAVCRPTSYRRTSHRFPYPSLWHSKRASIVKRSTVTGNDLTLFVWPPSLTSSQSVQHNNRTKSITRSTRSSITRRIRTPSTLLLRPNRITNQQLR